jgi:dynein assembly factor 2
MEDLTASEQRRLMECMKEPKFLELLSEYAKEISDPKNREENEQYLRELEKEGNLSNINCQIIFPQPCFCVQTRVINDENKPLFLNICSSDKIGRIEEVKTTDCSGKQGINYSIPLCISKKKIESKYQVYDVTYHPETSIRALGNVKFQQMIIQLAVETIERNYGEKLEQKYVVCDFQSKGNPSPIMLKGKNQEIVTSDKGSMHISSTQKQNENKDSDLAEKLTNAFERSILGENTGERLNDLKLPGSEKSSSKKLITELSSEKNNDVTDEGYTIPKYSIIHRGYFDMGDYTMQNNDTTYRIPRELVIKICLPRLISAVGIDLDISADMLMLKEDDKMYKLEIELPYKVYENNGEAKFDKKNKQLVVVLPVRKPEKPPSIPFTETMEVEQTIEKSTTNETVNNLEKQMNREETEESNMKFIESICQEKELLEPDVNHSVRATDTEKDQTQSRPTVVHNTVFTNRYLREID